jgi:hypothetical protein
VTRAHESSFALGVGLGMLLGIAFSSMVLLRLGSGLAGLLRGSLARLGERDRRVAFEALLQ